MKIAFVLEASTVAGGHRNVFSLANHLADRGHDVRVFCTGPDESSWMDVRVPVISTSGYSQLDQHLEAFDGVKIATWWKTAAPVARTGGGFYFVQDIETSYGNHLYGAKVLASYRLGLKAFTYGKWIQGEYARLGLGEIPCVGMAVEPSIFYPTDQTPMSNIVLYHEREHPLKGPELRRQVIGGLGRGYTPMGYSPWSPKNHDVAHLRNPTDEELAEQMRQSMVLLVTSLHEGFCLPALEAMACGLPVVTTYADGNEEFCEHEVNCLMGRTAAELIGHIKALRDDPALWQKMRAGGLVTAKRYNWHDTAQRVEAVLSG